MPEPQQRPDSGTGLPRPSTSKSSSKSIYVILGICTLAVVVLLQEDALESALGNYLVAGKIVQFTDLELWMAQKTSDANLRLLLYEDVLKKISKTAPLRPVIELDLARQYISSGQPERALQHAGNCLNSLSSSKTNELDAQALLSSVENLLGSYPCKSLQNERITLLAQTLEELLRNRAGSVRAKQVALVLLDQVKIADTGCNAAALHVAAIAVTKLLKQRIITWSNAELSRFDRLCELSSADDAEQLYRAVINNHGTGDLEIGAAEIKLLGKLRTTSPTQAHAYMESLLRSSGGEMSAHRLSVLQAAINMALADGKSDQAESFLEQIRQLSPEHGADLKDLEARITESRRKKQVSDVFRI